MSVEGVTEMAATRQPRLLGIRGRRVLLTLHVCIVSLWTGSLVAMLTLQAVKDGMTDGARLAALDLAMLRVHDTVAVNAAFVIVLTGLTFSLFTKWGAFRFWWVVLKWITVVALFLLVIFGVIPAVNRMAALSDTFREVAPTMPAYAGSVRAATLYLLVELALVVALITVSVFKPWGRREPRRATPRWVALAVGGALAAVVVANVWMTATQLATYRRLPVADVDLSRIADGEYEGEATFGFTYGVRVMISGGGISDVAVTRNRGSGYARLAELVRTKVLRAQRLGIDGVSGATTTSKALLKAMEDALQRAPRLPAPRS